MYRWRKTFLTFHPSTAILRWGLLLESVSARTRRHPSYSSISLLYIFFLYAPLYCRLFADVCVARVVHFSFTASASFLRSVGADTNNFHTRLLHPSPIPAIPIRANSTLSATCRHTTAWLRADQRRTLNPFIWLMKYLCTHHSYCPNHSTNRLYLRYQDVLIARCDDCPASGLSPTKITTITTTDHPRLGSLCRIFISNRLNIFVSEK